MAVDNPLHSRQSNSGPGIFRRFMHALKKRQNSFWAYFISKPAPLSRTKKSGLRAANPEHPVRPRIQNSMRAWSRFTGKFAGVIEEIGEHDLQQSIVTLRRCTRLDYKLDLTVSMGSSWSRAATVWARAVRVNCSPNAFRRGMCGQVCSRSSIRRPMRCVSERTRSKYWRPWESSFSPQSFQQSQAPPVYAAKRRPSNHAKPNRKKPPIHDWKTSSWAVRRRTRWSNSAFS